MKTNLLLGRPRWHGLALGPAFVALALWVSPISVRAELPAPDNILYGLIVLDSKPVAASASDFVVEARRANGLPVARYRMGDRPAAGNHYVLAIKVEEIAPRRDAASVLVNETLTIVVVSNSVEQVQQDFTLVERGQVQQLDFGMLPTNVLRGFEAWAWAWGFGTNSQDLDGDADGISNQAEYFAGTNPTNGASGFVLRIAGSNAHARISFDAVRTEGTGYEGRTRHYALERSTDVRLGNWQAVLGYSDVVGSNQVVVYDTLTFDAPLFYRGKVWLDDSALSGEFRLLVSRDAGQMTISFTAPGQDTQGRNRYYTLERATNLNGSPWMAVPGWSNVLGNNQTVTHSVPVTGTGPAFYRGRMELRNP